jgi:hypothetical protein
MRKLVTLVGLWGCAPPEDDNGCAVESELEDFQAVCSQALLGLYPEQTILELPGGSDATLTAYLEADPSIQAYGGQTGNSLTVILEVGSESWTAVGRKTTLTFASLDDQTAELRIDAHFADGLNVDGFGIQGPFEATVISSLLDDTASED